MPIFEYLCRGCSRTFESLVRRDEEVRCPYCGSTELERLLSTFSLSGTQSGPSCGPCTPSPSKCSSCK